MNDLVVKPVKITLDRDRYLLMDMNALQELEDIYEKEPPSFVTDKDGNILSERDPLSKALNAFSTDKKKIKHIKNFLYAGLVYEDASLTPKKIGSMISFPRLDEITDQIWQAVVQALPDAKEGSEAKSGE